MEYLHGEHGPCTSPPTYQRSSQPSPWELPDWPHLFSHLPLAAWLGSRGSDVVEHSQAILPTPCSGLNSAISDSRTYWL